MRKPAFWIVVAISSIALAGDSRPLSAQRWQISRASAGPIAVPAAVRQLSAFADLEYDDSSRVFGVVADLDHDGHPDLVIRSATTLCGNSACNWVVIDGATRRGVAALSAGTIYIDATAHGYPTLHSISSISANSARWETYVYRRGTYRLLSRRTFTGRRLYSLTRELSRVREGPRERR